MTFFSGQACDPKLSCFLLERKKICILSCEPLLWALWVKSSINEVARRSGCLSSKSMISLSVKLPKVSPGVREDHVRLTESRPAWVLIFPDERNRQGVPTDEQERASQRGTSLFIPIGRQENGRAPIWSIPILLSMQNRIMFIQNCLLGRYTRGFKSSLFLP